MFSKQNLSLQTYLAKTSLLREAYLLSDGTVACMNVLGLFCPTCLVTPAGLGCDALHFAPPAKWRCTVIMVVVSSFGTFVFEIAVS